MAGGGGGEACCGAAAGASVCAAPLLSGGATFVACRFGVGRADSPAGLRGAIARAVAKSIATVAVEETGGAEAAETFAAVAAPAPELRVLGGLGCRSSSMISKYAPLDLTGGVSVSISSSV